MIQFEHVTKRYPGGLTALSQVDLSVQKGELVFVTGHSGAGKSTLLRLTMCLERPTVGRVLLYNQDIANITRREELAALRRKMGCVFQENTLLLDRNVFQNVAIPLEISGFERREMHRRVRAALDKVGLLHKERASPAHLSSGEQQRVGIARAVVNRPGILLADEPTGNLDPVLSLEIMRLFQEFQRVGVCVLIASHDSSVIAQFSVRILTLHQGFLVQDQPATHPAEPAYY